MQHPTFSLLLFLLLVLRALAIATVIPPSAPSLCAMSGGGGRLTVAIPVVTVRVPCVLSGSRLDPECAHACADVCRVSRAFTSITIAYTMSLMLGSTPHAPSWHGLWLRLIENTKPTRGRSCLSPHHL